ncbi:aminopeptidase P family protein [bacterium]|nr:aminopeptidase P family protein [bacterium]
MRIDKVRQELAKSGLDAALFFGGTNVRFLCGYSGSNGLLYIDRENAIFFTDFRYKTQAPLEVKGAEIVVPERDSLAEALSKRPELKAISSIGFEKSIAWGTLDNLKRLFKRGLRWEAMDDFVGTMRAVKTPEEIERIKAAIRAAEDGMKAALPLLRPGIVERDFAAELEYRMRKAGADKNSFDTIVVSGKRSAVVHGIAGDKIIEAGDFVTVDFGAFVDGYASDMTRTFIMGEPSEKQREIYELVFRAQKAGFEAARPGLRGKQLDAVARKVIEDAGYGEFFGHGLGHGLGLLVHDSPTVGSKSENILPENAVITIEPGVYIPDFGGVRIEDDIRLTANGNEILTSLPRAIEDIIIE